MGSPATHAAINAVWRIESARLIAALARMTGDVGLAEDLALAGEPALKGYHLTLASIRPSRTQLSASTPSRRSRS
jgi:predicted RNA polymerase sigma factor